MKNATLEELRAAKVAAQVTAEIARFAEYNGITFLEALRLVADMPDDSPPSASVGRSGE